MTPDAAAAEAAEAAEAAGAAGAAVAVGLAAGNVKPPFWPQACNSGTTLTPTITITAQRDK